MTTTSQLIIRTWNINLQLKDQSVLFLFNLRRYAVIVFLFFVFVYELPRAFVEILVTSPSLVFSVYFFLSPTLSFILVTLQVDWTLFSFLFVCVLARI